MKIFKGLLTKSQAVIGLIGIVAVIGVLIFVPDETMRFTLIMPIFAGYIFYLILTTDFEDEEENPTGISSSEPPKEEKKKTKKK